MADHIVNDIQVSKTTGESITDLDPPRQDSLFPIDIINTYPNDQNSADMKLIGSGRDNRDYAIKTVSDGSGFVPASELFCYELARYLHIPTPEHALVKLLDGTLAFGSVWQGSSTTVASNTQYMNIFTGQALDNRIYDTISRIHGMDLFVNNIDRHFGNYMFNEGYNRVLVFAFDFSRAWMEIDYKGTEVIIPSETNKTLLCKDFVSQFKIIDSSIVMNTLDLIGNLSITKISSIINRIPDAWLNSRIKSEIITWWGSDDFIKRLSTLKVEAQK